MFRNRCSRFVDNVIFEMVEEGRARLVFKSPSSFQGTLESATGGIFSIKSIECTRRSDKFVDIQVVDGDTGLQFLIVEATVKYDGQSASIAHPSLDYASEERLIGIKARREIRECLNPRLAVKDVNHVVLKGTMKIILLACYLKKPDLRRETRRKTSIITEYKDYFA